MKQLKKVISIILCICLFGGHIAANPYDVEDTYLLKILHILGCFDILYEEGSTANFRPDDTVLRAEAVGDILKIVGQDVIDYDNTHSPTFSDVGEESEYFDIIETAAEIGIVSGYNGDFKPENSISYNEFVRMLCVALGYGGAAETSGGYPDGYTKIASSFDLNKRVKLTTGDLTRRDYAVMLYNALSAPIMTMSGEKGDMKPNSKRTLLSEVHDGINGKGVVTENGYTSIYSPGGVGKGNIKIDDTLFLTGEIDADSLIGHYVEYFAKENEYGDLVLLGIWADEERVVELNSSEIIPERCDFGAIYAQPDGKSSIKKYKIVTNADVIYNSQARVFDDVDIITPNAGKVVLSDTDGNGDYDVIIVTDYTVRLAESVSEDTKKILFKDGLGNIILDEENYFDYTIQYDGKEIGLSEIKEWDTLHIAYPPNADTGKLEVVVNRKTASGMIESKDIEEIQIGGTLYMINAGYTPARLQNAKPGQNVTAIIDLFGKIIDIQPVAGTESCGFLYAIRYLEDTEQARLTIFTEAGEWIKVNTAKKVRFNEQKTDADEIVAALQCDGDANGVRIDASGYMIDIWGRYIKYTADGNGFEVATEADKQLGTGETKPITDRQLIMYSLNDEDELMTITQADKVTNGNGFIMHGDYTKEPGVNYYDGMRGFFVNSWGGGNACPSFYADEDTTMFFLPFRYPDDMELYDVKMGGYGYFSNRAPVWKVRTYGYEDDPELGYVPYLVTEAETALRAASGPIVVDRVHPFVNEDGEIEFKLSGHADGIYQEWLAETKDVFKKRSGEILKFGDVVLLNYKSDGSVESVLDSTEYYGDVGIIFDTDHSDYEQMGTTGTSFRYSGKVVGKVTDVDRTKLRIALDTRESDLTIGGMPTTRVLGLWRSWRVSVIYIVDREDKTVTVGDINDVEIGDFVASSTGNGRVDCVVIYRN